MRDIVKKRGQYHLAAVVLIPVISLVIVFWWVFLPILADIMGLQETTYFEKNFLARDMVTIINALYASPGNTIVNYDKDTYWFSYEFTKENVAVFDETITLQTKTKYPLIGSNLHFPTVGLNARFSGDKSKDNLEESVVVVFSKIGDDVSIGNKPKKNINTLRCPSAEPINFDEKVVLIDAGHGGEDFGAVSDNVKEKNIAGAIGFSLYSSLKNKKFFTRENIGGNIDAQIRKAEYKSKDKIIKDIDENGIELILSIHTGNYNSQSNNIKAYYSIESSKEMQEKNRKVACIILNELLDGLDFTGASVIGIHPEDYEGGEILVKDKIAILFEIGNIRNQGSVNVITKPQNIQSISNSMIEGLKNA